VVARLEPGRRRKVSQKFTEGPNFFPPNPASGKRFRLTSAKNGLEKRVPAESIEEADAIYRKV
jgi:hypothetical protein